MAYEPMSFNMRFAFATHMPAPASWEPPPVGWRVGMKGADSGACRDWKLLNLS
jgi:hypothetical protein